MPRISTLTGELELEFPNPANVVVATVQHPRTAPGMSHGQALIASTQTPSLAPARQLSGGGGRVAVLGVREGKFKSSHQLSDESRAFRLGGVEMVQSLELRSRFGVPMGLCHCPTLQTRGLELLFEQPGNIQEGFRGTDITVKHRQMRPYCYETGNR